MKPTTDIFGRLGDIIRPQTNSKSVQDLTPFELYEIDQFQDKNRGFSDEDDKWPDEWDGFEDED